MIDRLTITIEDATHPDAQELIRQLTAELGGQYGRDGAGAFSPDDVKTPRAAFLVARIDNKPVGCGAIKPFAGDPPSVEVKRMFVIPEMRGQGISRLILHKLELLAASFGYTTLKLETGVNQTEAIGLYISEGYSPIPCYGQYAGDPHSLCYGKPVPSPQNS